MPTARKRSTADTRERAIGRMFAAGRDPMLEELTRDMEFIRMLEQADKQTKPAPSPERAKLLADARQAQFEYAAAYTKAADRFMEPYAGAYSKTPEDRALYGERWRQFFLNPDRVEEVRASPEIAPLYKRMVEASKKAGVDPVPPGNIPTPREPDRRPNVG